MKKLLFLTIMPYILLHSNDIHNAVQPSSDRYADVTEFVYYLAQFHCRSLIQPGDGDKKKLCSLLERFFKGNRDLFAGSWLYERGDVVWQQHPIIHLDFSLLAAENYEELRQWIMRSLNIIAHDYSVGYLEYTDPVHVLKKLAMRLSKKYGSVPRIVLIIEEYDKVLIEHTRNKQIASDLHRLLENFYEGIQGLDRYWQFVFITGSGQDNLSTLFSIDYCADLSKDPRYWSIRDNP